MAALRYCTGRGGTNAQHAKWTGQAYTVYEILDTVHCIGSSSNADETSGVIWPMTVSAYTKQMQSRRGSRADIAMLNSSACVAVSAVSAVGQAVVMGQLPSCLLQSTIVITVCLDCLSATPLSTVACCSFVAGVAQSRSSTHGRRGLAVGWKERPKLFAHLASSARPKADSPMDM